MEISGIKPELNQVIKEAQTLAKGASIPSGETALATENTQAAQTNVETLKELLISYGLNPGSDNIELLQSLIESSMPSDKETLLKLNQAVKLFNLLGENSAEGANKAQNMERAVFALKNQLPIGKETVNKLDAFLGEGKNINNNLNTVAKELIAMGESETADSLIRIFSGEGEADELSAFMTKTAAETLEKANSENVTTNTQNSANAAKPENTPANTNSTKLTDNQTREIIKLIETTLEPGEKLEPKEFTAKLEALIKPEKGLTQSEARLILSEVIKNEPQLAEKLNDFAEIRKNDVNIPDKPQVKVKDLFNKFSLEPKENNLNKLEENLNDLKAKVDKALETIKNSSDKMPESLTKALNDINNNLEFMNQLKTCTFIPIPLNAPTGKMEGELYVFNDKKNKGKKQASSALIGLNTVSLGRIEAYIQKQNEKLSMQFRLENTDVSKIINANAKTLVNLLEGAGLKLMGLSVIPLSEPFDVTKKEPDGKDASYDLSDKTFDMKA